MRMHMCVCARVCGEGGVRELIRHEREKPSNISHTQIDALQDQLFREPQYGKSLRVPSREAGVCILEGNVGLAQAPHKQWWRATAAT